MFSSSTLASSGTVTGKAKNGGADSAPLCLSHSHSESIVWENVSAGHAVSFELKEL